MGAAAGGAVWAAISAGERIHSLAIQVVTDDTITAATTNMTSLRRFISGTHLLTSVIAKCCLPRAAIVPLPVISSQRLSVHLGLDLSVDAVGVLDLALQVGEGDRDLLILELAKRLRPGAGQRAGILPLGQFLEALLVFLDDLVLVGLVLVAEIVHALGPAALRLDDPRIGVDEHVLRVDVGALELSGREDLRNRLPGAPTRRREVLLVEREGEVRVGVLAEEGTEVGDLVVLGEAVVDREVRSEPGVADGVVVARRDGEPPLLLVRPSGVAGLLAYPRLRSLDRLDVDGDVLEARSGHALRDQGLRLLYMLGELLFGETELLDAGKRRLIFRAGSPTTCREGEGDRRDGDEQPGALQHLHHGKGNSSGSVLAYTSGVISYARVSCSSTC